MTATGDCHVSVTSCTFMHAYLAMLIIVVVHKYYSCIELLAASLPWKLAKYLLEPWKVHDRKESFRQEPAQVIQVVYAKCVGYSAIVAQLQPSRSSQWLHP